MGCRIFINLIFDQKLARIIFLPCLPKISIMATDPKKNYPLPKFHFEVDWGGTRIGFTEISGLDFETEVIEYREGSYKSYNKTKQPGLTKYSNITLKRGGVSRRFRILPTLEKNYSIPGGCRSVPP